MQLKQKLKKAIFSCIAVIGVATIFGSVMAVAYETTNYPGAVRAVWEDFRANPQATAQDTLSDIVAFFAGADSETSVATVATCSLVQPPVAQATVPRQKEAVPVRSSATRATVPRQKEVTLAAPAAQPTVPRQEEAMPVRSSATRATVPRQEEVTLAAPAAQPTVPRQEEVTLAAPAAQPTAPRQEEAILVAPIAQPPTEQLFVSANPIGEIVFLRDQYALGVRLLNEDRQRHGLHALKPHPVLMKLAEKKAADLITFGYFAHYSPRLGHPEEMINRYIHPNPVWSGENLIALKSGPPMCFDLMLLSMCPRQAQKDFMASPGHRNAILSHGTEHVGYAFAIGKSPITEETSYTTGPYWAVIVQLFATEVRVSVHGVR